MRRWLNILTGVWVLGWLGIEDNGVWGVATLGVCISALSVIGWLSTRYPVASLPTKQRLLLMGLGGVLWGSGAVLVIVGLMFFKTAWHAHLVPDYPTPMMLDMLARLPVWALVGGLLGFGISLLPFYESA